MRVDSRIEWIQFQAEPHMAFDASNATDILRSC